MAALNCLALLFLQYNIEERVRSHTQLPKTKICTDSLPVASGLAPSTAAPATTARVASPTTDIRPRAKQANTAGLSKCCHIAIALLLPASTPPSTHIGWSRREGIEETLGWVVGRLFFCIRRHIVRRRARLVEFRVRRREIKVGGGHGDLVLGVAAVATAVLGLAELTHCTFDVLEGRIRSVDRVCALPALRRGAGRLLDYSARIDDRRILVHAARVRRLRVVHGQIFDFTGAEDDVFVWLSDRRNELVGWPASDGRQRDGAKGVRSTAHLRPSVPIENTRLSWIVDAAGSMPARMPR